MSPIVFFYVMPLYFISFSVVDSADILRSLLNNSHPEVRPRVDGKHGCNILIFTYCTHTQRTQLYDYIIIIIIIIIIIVIIIIIIISSSISIIIIIIIIIIIVAEE